MAAVASQFGELPQAGGGPLAAVGPPNRKSYSILNNDQYNLTAIFIDEMSESMHTYVIDVKPTVEDVGDKSGYPSRQSDCVC